MTILFLRALYDQDGTQTWQIANLVIKSSQCSLFIVARPSDTNQRRKYKKAKRKQSQPFPGVDIEENTLPSPFLAVHM